MLAKKSIKTNKHSCSAIVAVVNVTNAVPKRMLQLTGMLEKFGRVEQICWRRFERGNVDNVTLIEAKNIIKFALQIAWCVVKNRYQIILFDDMRLLPILVTVGRFSRSKLIYNRQEIPTLVAAQQAAKILGVPIRFLKPLIESAETFFVRGVNGVLSVPLKGVEYDRISAWRKPSAFIWNVPDASDVQYLHAPRNKKNKPFTLIYSGAVAHENGLVQYLKLVRQLEQDGIDTRLILIGRLWRMELSDLNRLIQEELCFSRVDYREWVPYGELLELLRSADVGLALSDPAFEKYKLLGEGASRKLFTYMAVGLPVISGGAFGSFIEESGSGYFVRYDSEIELLNVAKLLFSDSELRQSLGDCGRNEILNNYNFQFEMNKILYVFNKALS